MAACEAGILCCTYFLSCMEGVVYEPPEENIRCLLSRASPWSWSCSSGVGWLARKLLGSAFTHSPKLGVQAHVPMPRFLMWVLGIWTQALCFPMYTLSSPKYTLWTSDSHQNPPSFTQQQIQFHNWKYNWIYWLIPVIPAHRQPRRADLEFKVSLNNCPTSSNKSQMWWLTGNFSICR